MVRSLLAFSVLGLGFIAFGCDTEDPNATGSSANNAVTRDAACTALASSVCAKVQSCSAFLLELEFGDLVKCEERVALGCPSVFDLAGATTIPDDTKACADGFSTLSCEDLYGRRLPAACAPPKGSLADGAACGREVQCASQYCKAQGELCGVCTTPSAAGEACVNGEDCEPGLDCANSKCVLPGDENAICGNMAPCKLGLACVAGKCVKTVGAGESCDVAAPNCDFLQGLACSSMGVCQKIKLAGSGEACGVQGTDFVFCKGSGFCKVDMGANAGTCLAPAADGAACDTVAGPNCMSGALCKGNVCTLDDGSSCN